jgi:hypothetical protein
LAKNYIEFAFINYLNKIIIRYSDEYFDYILLVRGEAFTPNAMEILKQRFKKATYILYLWDSIKNNDTTSIFGFFDKVLSFDIADCVKYNLIHRPLFFLDDYAKVSDVKLRNYDIVFIGTVHGNRYQFANKLFEQATESRLVCFFYFYLPSKLLYLKYKLIGTIPFDTSMSDFNFKMMKSNEAADILSLSKVSIDVQHSQQTGLTMRTIEVFGAKRKLITTNKQIANYDFYDPVNIRIVEFNNFELDLDFINTPYKESEADLYFKYSVHGWLNEIFG